MNTKSIFQSKTFAGLAAILIGQILQSKFPNALPADIQSYTQNILDFGGLLLAGYGRLNATQGLHIPNPLPPSVPPAAITMLLCCFAVASFGCATAPTASQLALIQNNTQILVSEALVADPSLKPDLKTASIALSLAVSVDPSNPQAAITAVDKAVTNPKAQIIVNQLITDSNAALPAVALGLAAAVK